MDPFVTIISTSTSAINGTWSVNDARILRVGLQVASIGATGKFTNGLTTIEWLDPESGADVVFPSTALFIAWAIAFAQFATATELASYHRAALPSSTITIA